MSCTLMVATTVKNIIPDTIFLLDRDGTANMVNLK